MDGTGLGPGAGPGHDHGARRQPRHSDEDPAAARDARPRRRCAAWNWMSPACARSTGTPQGPPLGAPWMTPLTCPCREWLVSAYAGGRGGRAGRAAAPGWNPV